MGDWPDSVTRVAAFLDASRGEARIEAFAEETATAEEAAEAVGADPGAIVKSLVAICDGHAVLALVPGDRRADLAKIARAAGAADARLARPSEVEAATGFGPGAVAPFPRGRIERVLVEKTLLARDVLWVGAGSTRHMAALSARELARLTDALAADLVEV